jgi:hypothetical protein
VTLITIWVCINTLTNGESSACVQNAMTTIPHHHWLKGTRLEMKKNTPHTALAGKTALVCAGSGQTWRRKADACNRPSRGGELTPGMTARPPQAAVKLRCSGESWNGRYATSDDAIELLVEVGNSS